MSSLLPLAAPLRGGVGEGVPFDCFCAVDGDLRGGPSPQGEGNLGRFVAHMHLRRSRLAYRPSWMWPYGGIPPGSRLRRAQALASRRASSRQLAQRSMWVRAAAEGSRLAG